MMTAKVTNNAPIRCRIQSRANRSKKEHIHSKELSSGMLLRCCQSVIPQEISFPKEKLPSLNKTGGPGGKCTKELTSLIVRGKGSRRKKSISLFRGSGNVCSISLGFRFRLCFVWICSKVGTSERYWGLFKRDRVSCFHVIYSLKPELVCCLCVSCETRPITGQVQRPLVP